MTTDTAPAEFLCPISLELMKDPVMSRNGQNYDRRAILEWLNRGNNECPLTRQPLKPSSLIPNNSLKISIKTWMSEHEDYMEYARNSEPGNSDDDDDDDEKFRFVGLMSYNPDELQPKEVNENTTRTNSGRNSTTRTNNQESESDDLSDLLALYNEVLELTNAPLDSPLLQQSSRTTATVENMGEALNTAVQRNSRRTRLWRQPLKAFSKSK